MEVKEFISWIFVGAVFVLLVLPSLIKTIRNTVVGIKLRRRRKATPGPLLGVVYPKDIKDNK